MKRATTPHPRSHAHALAWRPADYVALPAEAADTFDDRVSEDIYDVDDERTEIDNIVHGVAYRAN